MDSGPTTQINKVKVCLWEWRSKGVRNRTQAAWGQVMVWSAGVGNLCFLQSKVTPTVYRSVLEDFLLPCAAGVYADAELVFQQELAPAHTARRPEPWFNVP